MNKKNMIATLVVLLVVQAALIAYLYRPGQQHSAPEISLVGSVDVQDITSLMITDENGKSLTLTKQGADWFVGEDKFPADETGVEAILAKLSGLKSSRLVSRTKSSHSRLKVGDEDFNRKVVLTSAKGETTLFIGTAPSSKSVHLRVAGQNDVYQVAGIAAWEVQPEVDSWWKSKYVELNADSIKALTIKNAGGTLRVKRGADGKLWELEEATAGVLDQKKVSELVSSLANISIAEYLKGAFTTQEKPVCTVDYQVDNKTITLRIWPKGTDNDDHVVKLSSASFYAKIRSYIIKEALVASSQVFMAIEPPAGDQMPTPAPEGPTPQ